MRSYLFCGLGGLLGLALAVASSAPASAEPLVPAQQLQALLFKPDLRIASMFQGGSRVYVLVANSGAADTTKPCLLRVWDIQKGKLNGVRFALVPPLKKGESRYLVVDFGNISLAQS